jgi:hypothetical protein
MSSDLSYEIKRASERPPLDGNWDAPVWKRANEAHVAVFHPAGSDHRPDVRVRVLYDSDALYVGFRVEDRYVQVRNTEYQSSVCGDSCAEFFVQPAGAPGYFNFEINGGGTMLLYYVTDPEDQGRTKVTSEDAATMEIFHSLPDTVEEEITDPITWILQYRVPFSLFENYVTPARPGAGDTWTGNFYKCGDRTSHPHWVSWAPVGDPLNFHKPERFAPLTFA